MNIATVLGNTSMLPALSVLPASIEVAHHSIGETPRPLPMHATEVNDLVNYVGTYPVESHYPIQFSIDVEAEGEPPASMDMRDLQPRS